MPTLPKTPLNLGDMARGLAEEQYEINEGSRKYRARKQREAERAQRDVESEARNAGLEAAGQRIESMVAPGLPEVPTAAAPVKYASDAIKPEEDDPARAYDPLGNPQNVLTRAELEGDVIPSGVTDGVGGPPTGLTDADIINLKQRKQEREASRLAAETRSRLLDAPTTPDQAAADLDIATRSGVNRIEVEQNRETFTAADKAKEIDQVYEKAPLLRDWAMDRANFDVAHDDLKNLEWWETAGKELQPGSLSGGEAKQALEAGTDRALEGLVGAAQLGTQINQFLFGWIPGMGEGSKAGEEAARSIRQTLSRNAEANTPQGDTWLEGGIYDAIQSAPQTAAAVIASVLTKSPFVGAGSAGLATGGAAFGEAEDEGKDFLSSLRYGLTQGGIETATEFLPLKFLVGDLAADSPFFKTLMKQAVTEGLTEQVATFTQDASTWLELNPEKTVGEFFAERPEAAVRTLIASTIMSTAQTTVAKVTQKAADQFVENAKQRRSEELERTFDAMAKGAKDSALLRRLPDKYREAVAQVTKDGPLESVRVTSEAMTELAQSNNLTPEKLAQAFRIDPNELISAIQAGEDVVIPSGNYAAALGTAKKELGISGESIHTALAPNMRLRDDDFTAKEWEAHQQVVAEEAEARRKEFENESAFADSAERVGERIRSMVANTKLFNTETANTQAAIAEAMVATFGQRLNIDPEEFFNSSMGFDVVAALKGDDAEDSLPQGKRRTAIEVDDATLARASQELSEYYFLIWKAAALEGRANHEIANDEEIAAARAKTGSSQDAMPGPEIVSVALAQIKQKGFPVPEAPRGPDDALRRQVEALLDQGLSSKVIHERLGRPAEKRNATNALVSKIRKQRRELALAQGDTRGSFSPRADRNVIRLFESSNLSTFVHEASHWYLDTLWRMSKVENPNPFVMEQFAAILEWHGKSPNWDAMFAEGRFTEEGRDLQEAFAETFEAYLREGKAPSTGLRSVFATLKQWLLRIYKSVTQIGRRVNLNPEIAAVFDRMLATDEAIKAATATQARDSEAMAQALLDKGVITPKAFERTKERLAVAREKAEAELMARLMEDYERNQKSWWKSEERQVRAEVTSEIDERPEQRAYQWLSGGGWRSTQADVVNAAASQAETMATLEQQVVEITRYFEPDATDESLAALANRMKADGRVPAILLFRTDNNRVIAFSGEDLDYSHDQGRNLLRLGNLKLDHGVYNPRLWPTLADMNAAGRTAWYDTTGDAKDKPASAEALGQFMPASSLKAPLAKLYDAISMLAQGESKQTAWQQTGWAQTLDGEWVYEIKGEPQWRTMLAEGHSTQGTLPDIIEWPELFEAMPELRRVVTKVSIGKQSGKFIPNSVAKTSDGRSFNVMWLQASGAIASSNTLMETLRHEIQHAIQYISGLKSQGASSPEVMTAKDSPVFKREVAYIREMEAKFNASPDIPAEQKTDLLSDEDVEQAAAYRLYRRNRGEVQAEDVELRSRWTQSLRDLLPPYTRGDGTEHPGMDRTWATLDDLRSDNLTRHDQGIPTGAKPVSIGGAGVSDWVRQPLARNRSDARTSEVSGDGQSGSGRAGDSLAQRVDTRLIVYRGSAEDELGVTENGRLGLGLYAAEDPEIGAEWGGPTGKVEAYEVNGRLFDLDEKTSQKLENYEKQEDSPQAKALFAKLKKEGYVGVRDPWSGHINVFVEGAMVRYPAGDRVVGRTWTNEDSLGQSTGKQPGESLEQILADLEADTSLPRKMKEQMRRTLERMIAEDKDEGSGQLLSQSGDGATRTSPPPTLPPMRLNLAAVAEQYGAEALAGLPPAVRAYAAAATDADQFIQIARDVRRTLNQKKPKTLTKFLSTRRMIGSGNDKIAYSGIEDNGEFTASFIGAEPPKGLLVSPKAKDRKTRPYTMSSAVMAAWEEGYFTGSPPTPEVFIDALVNDANGLSPVYAKTDLATVQEIKDAEAWEQWFDIQGIDIAAPIPELRAKLEEVLSGEAENAISPDDAASFFKMPDGNALLQGLKQGPQRDALIRAETQRRMIERHGDPFRDGTIMREAEKFARNEVAQRQIEIELEALAKAAGKQFASNLAKQQAQENLRTKQVREVLNYNQWLILEQRWGKKALEAASKGKFDDAARYKQYQLINLHMFREGRKLAEDIEKTRKHLLDYGKKTKVARLYAAGEDYAQQMEGLLSDYQLRPESRRAENRRQARAAWIQQQMAGIDPYSSYRDPALTPTEQAAQAQEALEKSRVLSSLAEGVEAKNYKSLTVTEFLTVGDEADMIWRLATLKDRLLKEAERRRLSLAAEDIAAEIITNQPNKKPPEARESDSPGEILKRGGLKYFAMHRTLQSLAHQFAGGKDGGVFWRYIVKPLNEAFAKLSGIRKQMGTEMEKLFSVYTKAERNRFFKDRVHFASINESLTKQGRLAVALNWGNEKNRQRLMDSTGWTEEQVGEILNTLDKRDFDFVQSVWDYVDTWFPEANRVHEAVHGAPMDKVAPLEIATRFGIYRGGYYPIMFDPNLSSKSGQRKMEADAKVIAGQVGVRTQPGFGKKRVEGKVTLPLRLSVFDVIASHLDQVAQSIATEEALFDVGRLIKRTEVETAIVEHHGRQIYNTIVNTLVTTKFGLEGASGVLAHLRNGATVVGLGWKVATAALQPLGISNSIVRVGGYWMAKGYAAMGTDAVTIKRRASWATERSEFMRHRRQSQSPELAALKDSLKKTSLTPRWITQSMFALMTNVQFYSVDVPTWYGAFYKAQAAGLDEGDSIAQADQAVIDAQGGGELHQTAAIQTGAGTRYAAALRLLTNFMSYMVTTYNLTTQRVRNTKTPTQAIALGLDLVLMLAVPVAGKMMLDAWTKGGGDDDDDPLWEKYGREQVAFLLSPFVGVSQVAGSVRGDDSFGYRGPAGLGIFAEATRAGAAAAELDFDESFWRPANKTAGIVFHYPASQLDATVRGSMALWNGETTNPAAIFFGPPPN